MRPVFVVINSHPRALLQNFYHNHIHLLLDLLGGAPSFKPIENILPTIFIEIVLCSHCKTWSKLNWKWSKMAKKFSELRSCMTLASRARSETLARVMLEEIPLTGLVAARGVSQKLDKDVRQQSLHWMIKRHEVNYQFFNPNLYTQRPQFCILGLSRGIQGRSLWLSI